MGGNGQHQIFLNRLQQATVLLFGSGRPSRRTPVETFFRADAIKVSRPKFRALIPAIRRRPAARRRCRSFGSRRTPEKRRTAPNLPEPQIFLNRLQQATVLLLGSRWPSRRKPADAFSRADATKVSRPKFRALISPFSRHCARSNRARWSNSSHKEIPPKTEPQKASPCSPLLTASESPPLAPASLSAMTKAHFPKETSRSRCLLR